MQTCGINVWIIITQFVFPTTMKQNTLLEQPKKHQSITDIGRIDYGGFRIYFHVCNRANGWRLHWRSNGWKFEEKIIGD